MDRLFIETQFVNTSLVSHKNSSMELFSSDLLDQYGFLQKNDYNPNLKTALDLLKLSGFILIAESGMGKTYVMEQLSRQLPPSSVLSLNAVEFLGTPSEFSEILSNINNEIKYVFIDGIDENPDLVPVMFRKIPQILTNSQVFISSRNIKEIKAIQDKFSLPVYSLLPLSQENIRQIANEQNIDAHAFLERVIKSGLSPICAKPLGCNLLIRAYRNNSLSNEDCDSLWNDAILALCAENDSPNRRLLQEKIIISPEQCFDYSAKIALILKLSNRSIITKITPTSVDKNHVNFANFFSQDDFLIFNKILARGIFLPIGDNIFRFAHISYQDYLCAIGLTKYVDSRHWESILLSPDRDKIYPQWEGVTAWLASFNAKWREIVLNIQPELLFVSDYTIRAIGSEELCRALLLRSEQLDYWEIHSHILRKRFNRLDKEAIVPVLQNVFEHSSSTHQKEMAIEIVRECKIHELENDLAIIFCDPSEDLLLRKTAGYALNDFASKDTRLRCKSILQEDNCCLDLKGILFRMTWPELITLTEIGNHLIDNDRHIIDVYYMWLTHDFPKTLLYLSESQALEALRWAVSEVKDSKDHRSLILNLKRQIFTLCWIKFYNALFIPLLADGYLAFQKIYQNPFFDDSIHSTAPELCYGHHQLYSDTEKRLSFADNLIKSPEIKGDELTQFSFHLLNPSDVKYLFFKIETEENETIQRKWCLCLRCLQSGVPLPELSEQWNHVHEKFPDILEDDAATTIRKRDEYTQKNVVNEIARKKRQENKERERVAIRKENILFIKQALKNRTAHQYFSWMIKFFQHESEQDLIDYRGSAIWKEFSETEIFELAAAAKQFLLEGEKPQHQEDKVYLAYPCAFYMIYTEAPSDFESLPASVFDKFATELFHYAVFDHENILAPIFQKMKKAVPDTFSKALIEKINYDLAHGSFSITKFEYFLDENICSTIIACCISDTTDDTRRFHLLNAIKKFAPEVVSNFLYNNILNKTDDVKQWGNRSSILVFDFFPEKMDSFIHTISLEPEWGKTWLENIIMLNSYEHPLIPTFTLAPLDVKTQFYIWLRKTYPSELEPKHNGVYTPKPIDEIYTFISQIFNDIMESRTYGVATALQKIFDEFPDDHWLQECIREARKRDLAMAHPIYSSNVISALICSYHKGVLINSPKDLLNAVCNALNEYQVLLTGKETPQVEALWNVIGDVISHKKEEDFSDHLKKFLEMKLKPEGVIINREVQLNRGRNGEAGARTDIWIDALIKEKSEKISLCIEVKGSWNPSARTAMKEQLVDKYMGNGGADVGILLVGWFQSHKVPQKNIWGDNRDMARAELEQQAAKLTQSGYLIKSIVIDCEYRL